MAETSSSPSSSSPLNGSCKQMDTMQTHDRCLSRSRSLSIISDDSDSITSRDSHLSLDSNCGLKRQPHIRRRHKQRARPLPPRPLHWSEPPPPSAPTQKVRQLPTLPLPTTTPVPPRPQNDMLSQEIDWDAIDAIMCHAP